LGHIIKPSMDECKSKKNFMIGNTKLCADVYSKIMCIADENLVYAIFLVSTEVQFPKERG
jgi:hypothetical protein